MRTTLVMVLAMSVLALAWVLGLMLSLVAGFGLILLAIAAERLHTVTRQAEHGGSMVVIPVAVQDSHELYHERHRVA